jgi:signal transduction histidine kinase
MRSSSSFTRPIRIILAVVYLFYASVVIRTLANPNLRPRLIAYLALEFLYLVLFIVALSRSARQPVWQQPYFVFQSLLVLILVTLRPQFDFILVLFVLLSFQAALLLTGRTRWMWIGILALLTGVPLIFFLGVLRGLSSTLMPVTIGLVFPAFVTVTQEIETGLSNTQALLADLQDANRRLKSSAGQVEELSAIQERNRLARELHDSVSQTIFSISLHTRATQILLERDPDRLRPQLEQLQMLAHSALEEMRGLIADLRPQENESAGRPMP